MRTAGSVTLLSQAIFLPLCFAKGVSELTLIGGTHVPWSPSFHYLAEVLLPTIKRMGISAEAAIDQWGFYPKGGGRIRLKISPVHEFKPISLVDRGRLEKIRGLSAISHLPKHVGERQREQALKRIREEPEDRCEKSSCCLIFPRMNRVLSLSKSRLRTGSCWVFILRYKRKISRKSGRRSGSPSNRLHTTEGCIDPHLADQLVPFMALARGNSSFTTTQIRTIF